MQWVVFKEVMLLFERDGWDLSASPEGHAYIKALFSSLLHTLAVENGFNSLRNFSKSGPDLSSYAFQLNEWMTSLYQEAPPQVSLGVLMRGMDQNF